MPGIRESFHLIQRDLIPEYATKTSGGYLLAGIRGNRLYAVQEKPSGFKQLCVYRMNWK